MGLTLQSTQKGAIDSFSDSEYMDNENIIALAGNPNVGKSTVFNALTGLNQHTGNWPGKTVANAVGKFTFDNQEFTLVDLPGTYSLLSNSKEEEIARDFICSLKSKAIVVVADATCLERSLNLVLQILEITPNCMLCVNLMDQAEKKKISVDLFKLKEILGIEVVGICAARKNGTLPVKENVLKMCRKTQSKAFSIKYDSVIEESIKNISDAIESSGIPTILPYRYIAVKMICEWKCYDEFSKSHNINSVLNEELDKLSGFGITKDNINDRIACSIITSSEEIAKKCTRYDMQNYMDSDLKADRILTSKSLGIPIMLCLLGLIFYLSIIGANYPSTLLTHMFDYLEIPLVNFLNLLSLPVWINNIIIFGVYKTLARVVSVMLPPMAIFFPLFTILEDSGYLPRIAFNLDGVFKKCCAHGKQCLTMCMGIGCNAAGVTGARIIDSPRERLIAIITNNLVPCNGRFPTIITISTIFAGATLSTSGKYIVSSLIVLAVVVLGVLATFGLSFILSKTLLKGKPSQFTLELPPYRKPKIAEVLYRSVFDRTLFVLGRAIAVAAPAGAILWLTANIFIADKSLLNWGASFLNPFAKFIGLDGYILIAFILGIPANEIVMPILLMGYTASGTMADTVSLNEIGNLLISNGWNMLTAINFLLITLFHFPCATTLITIKKETKSFKWTFISFIVPTLMGIIICFITTQFYNLIA